ncbi:MAG: MATE family efflux transporter [candidate division WOR-3 bacterium]|nr:MAG: MATE family efflux transporter [candidate division WOR-3 bacterium]
MASESPADSDVPDSAAAGQAVRTLGLLQQKRIGVAIWHIAWPVMLMQMLYTTMTIVDMFWVGRLGHVAVAAVTLSGSVLAVLFSFGQIFGVSTMALAARAAGAESTAGVRDAIKYSLVPAVAIGAVIAAVGAPLSGPVLRLVRAAPEVVEAGRLYLMVIFLHIPSFFAGMVAYSVFQATGDTRTPMFVVVVSNVVNIVLDPILIFGWLGAPRLGLLGAALATAGSQLVWIVVVAVILGRRGLLRFGRGFEWSRVGTVFRIGVPAGLHAVTRPLTGTMLFAIVNGFGSVATAAFGIGLRILQVMWIYLGGLGAGGEALVGQSLGRRQPELAKKVGHRVSLIASVVQLGLMPLLFILAPTVVRVFNDNPEVVAFGTGYLRLLTPVLAVLGVSIGWASAQRGAGDTRPPMIAALVSNWAIKLPLAWVLAQYTGLGLTGVWVGIGASIVVETAMLGIWYRRGGWLKKELAWT